MMPTTTHFVAVPRTLRNVSVSACRPSRVLGCHRYMSAYSHMSDNDPEIIEKEKQKLLKHPQKGWNEKLASTSEANVKADQLEDVPLNRLQEETVAQLKKTDMEDAEDARVEVKKEKTTIHATIHPC